MVPTVGTLVPQKIEFERREMVQIFAMLCLHYLLTGRQRRKFRSDLECHRHSNPLFALGCRSLTTSCKPRPDVEKIHIESTFEPKQRQYDHTKAPGR